MKVQIKLLLASSLEFAFYPPARFLQPGRGSVKGESLERGVEPPQASLLDFSV